MAEPHSAPGSPAAPTAIGRRDPPAASVAGEYRLLEPLASGGTGCVWLAEQIGLGHRRVAVKVLHRRLAWDPECVARFEQAAAYTGRIRHPNVVTVYECRHPAEAAPFMAMELVEGHTLTAHLRQRGPLPLDEVIEIVAQCCAGLAAAHRLDIVHRDIKPGHIMLARDADGALAVKLLDFGIARIPDSNGHTVTGTILGTPTYMSYEQASGLSSTTLDGRSDIYALGIVTYEMLTGHPPFRAETPVACILKHVAEPPPPVRAARPDLPPGVETALARALEKDRARRYPTVAEFAAAVREAATGGNALPRCTR